MKPSKRNIENQIRKAEKLAAGKPLFSRYEKKNLTAEEIQERERKFFETQRKQRGGVITP